MVEHNRRPRTFVDTQLSVAFQSIIHNTHSEINKDSIEKVYSALKSLNEIAHYLHAMGLITCQDMVKLGRSLSPIVRAKNCDQYTSIYLTD